MIFAGFVSEIEIDLDNLNFWKGALYKTDDEEKYLDSMGTFVDEYGN